MGHVVENCPYRRMDSYRQDNVKSYFSSRSRMPTLVGHQQICRLRDISQRKYEEQSGIKWLQGIPETEGCKASMVTVYGSHLLLGFVTKHVGHRFMKSSILASIPGQYMVFLAIWDITVVPLCPVWRLFSVCSCWHSGITILSPFIRSPLSVLSSSRWSQYYLPICGTLFLWVGHPSLVKLCTMARIGSVAVSTDICLILSVVNPW